ncbi:MAG: class I SAM-dependent methyltransferase [Magnetococcus sp. DMHC-8]
MNTTVQPDPSAALPPDGPKKVLNVGGNSKEIPLPPHFQAWEHVLLDIDATGHPDILCDARTLTDLPPCQFDAVYCSHNLEHYYPHDAARVVQGFMHILKEDGFAHLRVPDLGQVMQIVVNSGLDIDDTLYQSPMGPITVRDVIYGYNKQIEQSGVDFFAHRTGFTAQSLRNLVGRQGFPHVFVRSDNLAVELFAFKGKVGDFVEQLSGFVYYNTRHTPPPV